MRPPRPAECVARLKELGANPNSAAASELVAELASMMAADPSLTQCRAIARLVRREAEGFALMPVCVSWRVIGEASLAWCRAYAHEIEVDADPANACMLRDIKTAIAIYEGALSPN